MILGENMLGRKYTWYNVQDGIVRKGDSQQNQKQNQNNSIKNQI
jgi:hypothetical protein